MVYCKYMGVVREYVFAIIKTLYSGCSHQKFDFLQGWMRSLACGERQAVIPQIAWQQNGAWCWYLFLLMRASVVANINPEGSPNLHGFNIGASTITIGFWGIVSLWIIWNPMEQLLVAHASISASRMQDFQGLDQAKGASLSVSCESD